MTTKFVLSAADDDSILAAKICVIANPGMVHLSASRKVKDLTEGSEIIFIRPWIHPDNLIDIERYGKYKTTVFHSIGSKMWEQRELLLQSGITCIWLTEEESFSKKLWKYYFPDKEYPEVVNLVHDYMKWELKMEHSIDWHYGTSIIDAKFSKEATEFFYDVLQNVSILRNRTLQNGKQIREYTDTILHFLGKELIFETSINKLPVLAANCLMANSAFFAQREDYHEKAYALNFTLDESTGKIRNIAYRIRPNLIMSDIVAQYGGKGNSGFATFVSDTMVTDNYSASRGEDIDYNVLLESDSIPEHVREYVLQNYCVRPYQVARVLYKGKRAFISNTPYLTRTNMFQHVLRTDEELGVTFCMQACGLYRVAVIRLDGTDPGPEYGDLVGNYRISVGIDQLESIESDVIGNDPFRH